MAKPRNSLPHVKHVRARGRSYYYFDTGAIKANGQPVYAKLPALTDPSFGNVYAGYVGGRTRRRNLAGQLTVAKLVELYQDSPKFSKLSSGTRKTYSVYLRQIESLIGSAPVNEVEPRDITRIMDGMAAKPGAANLILSVVGAVYKWGRQRHHVAKAVDPTADIEPFELGSHDPWPENIVRDALASDDDRVRLATHLLYYTAQRIGDVMRMRWNDILPDGTIRVIQDKSDKPLEIQLHTALAAELARTPRNGMTILCAQTGAPMSAQPVRIALKRFTDAYGVKLVPHGLRKNAVIALLESGCTVAEVAAVSGQSFPMVEYYAKLRNQKRLNNAAILKWEAKS